MSLATRAASSLVAKLEESRELSRNKTIRVGKGMRQLQSSSTDDMQELVIYYPPTRPTLSALDEEKESVLNLHVPKYDKTREFHGLIKLKVDRKERHAAAVDRFSALQGRIAEDLEKDLLQLSLKMREELERIDDKFKSYYKTLDDEKYTIVRSEKDLLAMRTTSADQINYRSLVIEKFAQDLDSLEMKRAKITGSELKKLVDELVGVAHQLPDEIEHIVENETFNLNNILITNRQSHSHLMLLLRKIQVKTEVETTQRWENCRTTWRRIRHEKGLNDFHSHINSSEFQNPKDRQEFLELVRREQENRHDMRKEQLNELAILLPESISSPAVRTIQAKFASVSEMEMAAIQVRTNFCDLIFI